MVTAARPTGRPPELEDWLNRQIYHPLARRLAVALQPTRVTPNMVSVAGALLICLAAVAYTTLAWPLSVALGFLCHVSWHVVDGADGDLARLTGKSSPTGELVDGLCDYAGHIALYVALAAFLAQELGGWAWFVASLAGASHIVQANHAESQRRIYLWWAYGRSWLAQAKSGDERAFPRFGWLGYVLRWGTAGYLALARAMNPHAEAVDAVFARSASDSQRTEALRAIVRGRARTSLSLQNLLGANPRAILLGASMAFGTPLWFFAVECVVLNALLALSIGYHRRYSRELAIRLAGARDGQCDG